ncbi:MAG: glutamate racemase [Enterovibrio sp.]
MTAAKKGESVRRVLVFDSGVGGLSVYQEIQKLLPAQPVIYAFDNEAFPYGELADEVLISRVQRMIEAICQRHEIALVVIACNTASTLVLPVLRARLSVPVVGVVPAIKPAAALSVNRRIGLLATPATIQRPYTQQLIQQFAADCHVTLIGSTQLVHMAEAKLRGKAPCLQTINDIVAPFTEAQVDCIVLGCTHFPLLKEEIAQASGAMCQVIDSGKAVALRVAELLHNAAPVSDSNCAAPIVMSSAKVEQEEALNAQLVKMGLTSVVRAAAF